MYQRTKSLLVTTTVVLVPFLILALAQSAHAVIPPPDFPSVPEDQDYFGKSDIVPTNGATGYGVSLPQSSTSSVGGSGKFFVTGTFSGCSLTTPRTITAPGGASADGFGRVVEDVFIYKDGSSSAFTSILVGDTTNRNVRFYAAILTATVNNRTFNVQGNCADVSPLQANSLPVTGTVLRKIQTLTQINTATCKLSTAVVASSTTTGGFLQVFGYNGMVAITAAGSFVQTQAVTGFAAGSNNGISVSFDHDNRLAVGSTNGRVNIFSVTKDTTNCQINVAPLSQIQQLTTSGFGTSVMLARSTITGTKYAAIGAPTSGFGQVFVYDLSNTNTPITTLQASSSGSTQTGMGFGQWVSWGNGNGGASNYLLVVSPNVDTKGRLSMYIADATTGELNFAWNANTTELPSGNSWTGVTTVCRNFYFPRADQNMVFLMIGNQGAYYPGFCTCKDEPRAAGVVYAVNTTAVAGVGSTTTCLPRPMANEKKCIMENAPSICGYPIKRFFEFTQIPPNAAPATTPCIYLEEEQRDIWRSNCYYDYVNLA